MVAALASVVASSDKFSFRSFASRPHPTHERLAKAEVKAGRKAKGRRWAKRSQCAEKHLNYLTAKTLCGSAGRRYSPTGNPEHPNPQKRLCGWSEGCLCPACLLNQYAGNEVCPHALQLLDSVLMRPWSYSPGSWVQVKNIET